MSLQRRYSRVPDYLFKLVLIGDSGVGKTQLLSRFTNSGFTHEHECTIGVEFATKTVEVGDKLVKVQIWDTAGQERFRALTAAYYNGAVGAMICYDITRPSSFKNVELWLQELKSYGQPTMAMVLIGNKTDLRQQQKVHTEEVVDFCKERGLSFLETSALDSSNIEEAFMMLIEQACQAQSKTLVSDEPTTTTIPPTIVLTPGKSFEMEQQKKEPRGRCCGV